MQTTHRAFNPHLNPSEQRAERTISAIENVSEQISALSLEQALIAIRENTAALAGIQENTRPFANLRFLYRYFRRPR
jgi:hypothetical protein